MPPRRRPIQRTRSYDIWTEYSSESVGPDDYRLALQLVDWLDDPDGTPMIRACYRKGKDMRVRPPVFTSAHWTTVLTQALADEEFFTVDELTRIAAACQERIQGTGS